jgi:hypothetical protein
MPATWYDDVMTTTSDIVTPADVRAFTDLCAEAYRALFNVPDDMDVEVKFSAYTNSTIQITLKLAV